MDWLMANQIMAEVVEYLNSIGVDTRKMTDKQLEDLAIVIHHDGKVWSDRNQEWIKRG